MIKVAMRPSHPGEFIRRQVLEPLELNITDAAKVLDVRRATLNDFVNGKSRLSAEMALRIEKAFDIDMGFLLRIQALYDTFYMRQKSDTVNVRRFQNA